MVKKPNRVSIFLLKQFAPTRYMESKRLEMLDKEMDEQKMKKELSKYEAELRESFKRSARNISIVIFILFPVVILSSYVLQKVLNPEFGMNVNIEFYSIAAQLLAGLLIALFLTGNPILDSSYSKKLRSLIDESLWLRMLSADRLPALYLFAAGQLACLSAVARGHSGTLVFLVSLVSITMLILLVFLKILRTR